MKTSHKKSKKRSPDATTRRRGKVARLPKELREEVNRLIEANTTSARIIEFLTQRGHPEINEVNITHWVKGNRAGSSGYADWLRERDQLAALSSHREFALEVVRQGDGPQIHEANRLLAAVQLSEVLIGFDVQSLKRTLSDRPLAFAMLVTALRRLSRDSLAYEKYRRLVAEQKEKLQRELGQAKTTGLTPEIVEKARNILQQI